MTSIITGQYKAYLLDSLEGLQLNGVLAKVVTHQGKQCLNLVPSPEVIHSDGPTFAILEGSNFHNGIIEISLSGTKPEDAATRDPSDFVGDFVGIGFRIESNEEKAAKIEPKLEPKRNPANVAQFECIYFRPAHALSEDQLTRNHSIQYFAYPEAKFNSLRKKYLQQEQSKQERTVQNKSLPKSSQLPKIFPKIYEAYAPIAAEEWFRIRIEVVGTTAKLYVNGAAEPALIVNDLKLGDCQGAIGLFVERECVGYYCDLKIIYYND